MAKLGWLNSNFGRDYPLKQGTLPTDDWQQVLLDGHFVLGVKAGFDQAIGTVRLVNVTIDASEIVFTFLIDQPELIDFGFRFRFPIGVEEGAVLHTVVEHLATEAARPDLGSAWVAIGRAELGIGSHVADSPVEPAIIQNLFNAYVCNINVANELRPCPPVCCAESSSSSSSPSPSGAQVEAENLQGAVKVKGGYNVDVRQFEPDNELVLRAAVGAGLGEPCEDIRINEDGLLVGEDCESCKGNVVSINGGASDEEHLVLAAGPGILLDPRPEEHSIIITVDTERLCTFQPGASEGA